MSKFNNQKIMPRYSVICMLMTIISLGVLIKAGYIMTAKRDYWMKVADRVKRDNVVIVAAGVQNLHGLSATSRCGQRLLMGR